MSTVRATSHADAHRSTLAEACRLLGLPEVTGARQVDTTFLHRRLKAGHRLTSQGEPFDALYIVAEGFFKTFVADETGNQLVLGFPAARRPGRRRRALQPPPCVVCRRADRCRSGRRAVPLASRTSAARSTTSSSSSTAPSAASWSPTTRCARSSARWARRPAWRASSRTSPIDAAAPAARPRASRFPMTRQEIGSYLGLTLETVSRAFSALADAGLLSVAQREAASCATWTSFARCRSCMRRPRCAPVPAAATVPRAAT